MVIYHQLHVNPQYSWIQTSWPPHCRVTGMMGIGLTIKVSGAIHPVWYIYCYSMSSSLFYVSTWPPPRDFPTDFFHLVSFYFYERSNAFCQPHASSVSHQHLRCQEELSRNDGTPSSFFTHFHGENHHQPWNLVGPQKTELSPWDLVSGGCWCGMGQVVARVKGTPFCPFLGAMVSWKNVCRSKKSRSPWGPPSRDIPKKLCWKMTQSGGNDDSVGIGRLSFWYERRVRKLD